MAVPQQTSIYIKDDASVNKTKSFKSHSKHEHSHSKARHQHNILTTPINITYAVIYVNLI